MARDAFVLKIQRELCHPRFALKVSGLSRNMPQTSQPLFLLKINLKAIIYLGIIHSSAKVSISEWKLFASFS